MPRMAAVRVAQKVALKVAMLVALVSGGSISASAYTLNRTQSGIPLRWKSGVALELVANSLNAGQLYPQGLFGVVTRALQSWKQASDGGLLFNYWQGTDPQMYPRNASFNGVSSLYFLSQNASTDLDPQVLGLTQVWFDSSTGEILEADVILNDRDFAFSLEDHDSGNRVAIANVVTHELGHAFGLSHSGAYDATMYPSETDQQSHLSCDDAAGAADVAQRIKSGTGSIRGQVLRQGKQLLGSHVLAYSVGAGGAMVESALTDDQGQFEIKGLNPGSYQLIVEPFNPGSSSVSSYYAGMNPRVCAGGSYFSRSYWGGISASWSVGANRVTDLGSSEVSCDANMTLPVAARCVMPDGTITPYQSPSSAPPTGGRGGPACATIERSGAPLSESQERSPAAFFAFFAMMGAMALGTLCLRRKLELGTMKP